MIYLVLIGAAHCDNTVLAASSRSELYFLPLSVEPPTTAVLGWLTGCCTLDCHAGHQV